MRVRNKDYVDRVRNNPGCKHLIDDQLVRFCHHTKSEREEYRLKRQAEQTYIESMAGPVTTYFLPKGG